MTKEQAWHEFRNTHIKGKFDYWTVQLEWACFTDSLCKDGDITQKQYRNWSTPIRYGKPHTFK